MRVDPNIPVWLAQSITGFSEVERMYALNFALNQIAPGLLPSIYAFCLSYRPAMSREAQMLVDQIGYKSTKTGAAMNGYQYTAPSMGGFRMHANADSNAASALAASCGFTRTPLSGGLGIFGGAVGPEQDIANAAKTGMSILNAITQAVGVPPQPGSQANPTGAYWQDMSPDEAFGPMPNLPVPTAPATPAAAPKPVVPVPVVTASRPMSTGTKVALGVGAVLLLGGIAYVATR